MIEVCHCSRCVSAGYNPEEYLVTDNDYIKLNKKRPFGLTGHLRVRDDALTLGLCIESVIDVFDELIITYQDSEDNTEEVVNKYALLYPEKIRAFHYKPYVPLFAFQDREDTTKYEEFPDHESIHNPANYYNFGYVKTRYQYYTKIDADQVYFTEKLHLLKKILKNKNTFQKVLRFIPTSLMPFLFSYSKKDKDLHSYYSPLKKKRICFVLGGINLYFKNEKLAILPNVTVQTHKGPVATSPLNGCVGDTVVFEPSSKIKYLWYKPTCMEYLLYEKRRDIFFGLCWWHLAFCKPERKQYTLAEEKSVSPQELATLSDEILEEKLFHFSKSTAIIRDFYKKALKFWSLDKKYIDYSLLNKIPSKEEFYKNEKKNTI